MVKLLLALTITTSALAMNVPAELQKFEGNKVRKCSDLADCDLYYSNKEFMVRDREGFKAVQPIWIDSILKKMNKKQLTAFLDNGYIGLSADNQGDYHLKAFLRLKGGGPVAACWLYGLFKGAYHGIAVAGFATAVSTVGTSVGAAVGAAKAGAFVGGAAASVITGGAAPVATAVGAGLVEAGAGTAAAGGMAVIAANGAAGWSAYFAGAEAAGFVGAWIGGMLPCP